eukprot:NODE_487_length_2691_cov_27.505841_g418_i0.p1 GENE.NODE_487_length_2691_cov_27.505841_g418_i0~~NODE_487_length_2691_cov_27.505841_g418_i0.p1  ORF type:complete len:841 (-),score=121.63 NODE_487_length_2691_cov_27.505841_g418_i0:113-2635(-)
MSSGIGHPLNGDGVTASLFYCLAKENKKLESARIQLASTVHFEQGFAKAWFVTQKSTDLFKTSTNNGRNPQLPLEVKRRVAKEVELEAIYNSFTKNVPDGNIAATFIPTQNSSSTNVNGPPSIRVFDNKELHNFLFNQIQKPTGILQKFYPPKGFGNSSIQVIWSPCILLCECRRNKNELSNTQISLFDRFFTFEVPNTGDEECPLVTTVSLTQPMRNKVAAACQAIANHFTVTEHMHIARMLLYFKADHNNSIRLLYSTSIRVVEKIGPIKQPTSLILENNAESVDNSPRITNVSNPLNLNLRLARSKTQLQLDSQQLAQAEMEFLAETSPQQPKLFKGQYKTTSNAAVRLQPINNLHLPSIYSTNKPQTLGNQSMLFDDATKIQSNNASPTTNLPSKVHIVETDTTNVHGSSMVLNKVDLDNQSSPLDVLISYRHMLPSSFPIQTLTTGLDMAAAEWEEFLHQKMKDSKQITKHITKPPSQYQTENHSPPKKMKQLALRSTLQNLSIQETVQSHSKETHIPEVHNNTNENKPRKMSIGNNNRVNGRKVSISVAVAPSVPQNPEIFSKQTSETIHISSIERAKPEERQFLKKKLTTLKALRKLEPTMPLDDEEEELLQRHAVLQTIECRDYLESLLYSLFSFYVTLAPGSAGEFYFEVPSHLICVLSDSLDYVLQRLHGQRIYSLRQHFESIVIPESPPITPTNQDRKNQRKKVHPTDKAQWLRDLALQSSHTQGLSLWPPDVNIDNVKLGVKIPPLVHIVSIIKGTLEDTQENLFSQLQIPNGYLYQKYLTHIRDQYIKTDSTEGLCQNCTLCEGCCPCLAATASEVRISTGDTDYNL